MAKSAGSTKSPVQRAARQPGKPGSFLGANALKNHLPPLPARESVVDLLVAARVPNVSLIHTAAACLVEIIRSNSWLLGFIAGDESYELISALNRVAGTLTRQKLGFTDLSFAPDFDTVVGKADPLPQTERLRAVYILARHSSRSALPADRLPSKAIDTLGGVILRLEKRSSNLLGAARLDSVSTATALEEIGERAACDLAVQKSTLAEDWPILWMPWIERLNARIRRPDEIATDPTEVPSPSLAWSTPDDDDGGEPGLDLPPITKPRLSAKGEIPPTSRFIAAFSDQAIRSRNLELSKDHIEVATDVELRVVVRHCQRIRERPGQTTGLDLAPSLLLLLISTGRQLPALADAYIHPACPPEGERHLVFDLKRGVLIQPVLVPDQIKTPSPENQGRFDTNTGVIELALPTLVLTFLRRMYSWRKVDRVIGWLDGIEPERLIRSFLGSISELPASSARSSAPYRRWLGCQLQEVGGDLAKTMLITGDTFGRSTAPLYYSSPTATDLAELYRSGLSGFFEVPISSLDASAEVRRVGPASIVRLPVAQAGVSQISKRLNINVDKAIADRDKAMRYHNALTGYLAHYIAIITSHRPTNALYALTRRQFDLRRHLAILQDKKADAEHFTRLVATTAALSESMACWRSLKIDHLCSLKIDQGWRPRGSPLGVGLDFRV